MSKLDSSQYIILLLQKLRKQSQKYKYWISVNPWLTSSNPVRGPTVSKFKALINLKHDFRNAKKSPFGKLCAYLMSCDTHHLTSLKYLSKEYSSKVSKRFEKYFSSYRADRLGHNFVTDGETDRRMDRRTDAGDDNTPSTLGQKNFRERQHPRPAEIKKMRTLAKSDHFIQLCLTW